MNTKTWELIKLPTKRNRPFSLCETEDGIAVALSDTLRKFRVYIYRNDSFFSLPLRGEGILEKIVFKNGKLFGAGLLQSVNDIDVQNVFEYDFSTNMAKSLGSGVSQWVYNLLIDDDYLYIQGDFTVAGGKSSAYFARWKIN